jgi:phosphoribosylanthranilate isomerase
MGLRVKICGITNLADALDAVEAGADALGFMFYDRSKRWVTADTVAKITSELPPFVLRVGVFVDPSPKTVREVADTCGLTALQFHGSEPPHFCLQFSLPVIKAIRLADKSSLSQLEQYQVSALLLDSAIAGQLGGTGEKGDWKLAREARKPGRRIILAGGLTPDNVADAVREVRPYGVDVSSGVEAVPGRKDSHKVAAFIRAARAAAEAVKDEL